MMAGSGFHMVTGAFGFTGRYIAQRLLDAGIEVRTLTNSTRRANPFGDRVRAYPLDFDQTEQLVAAMGGAAVLYNTYWVRFGGGRAGYAPAVENSRKLIHAARAAGVRRIVHISVANASEDAPFPYFQGKALVERTVVQSGLSHAIVRPTVLFGSGDILLNNIAWMLRRLPVFGVFGDGRYRLRPVYVGDVAALAVTLSGASDNRIIDAVGPETFTYQELVEAMCGILGRRRRIILVSPGVGLIIGGMIGRIVRDLVITREEIGALMAGLLCTNAETTGPTRFTEWATQHVGAFGQRYVREFARS